MLQCSECGYLGQTFGSIIRHLVSHENNYFRCGINGCTNQLKRLSLISHLHRKHPYIFSIDFNFESLILENSFFCVSSNSEQPSSLQLGSQLDHFLYEHSPDQSPIPSNSFNYSVEYIDQLKSFMTNIIDNYFSVNSSCFSTLSKFSKNLIGLFVNNDNEEFCSILYNILKSSESFDQHLELFFAPCFPQSIDIFDSSSSFCFFDIKKTLLNLIKNQITFNIEGNDILQESVNRNNIESFFNVYPLDNEKTIYVSLFVDDFNISNQLLSKKTSHSNKITGIYVRILSNNIYRSSIKSNVAPIALLKSDIFYMHSANILKFVGDEISIIINNYLEFSCDDLIFQFKLSIAYFSLDSLSASHLLGMKLSFNHPYCCRFCFTRRTDFKSTFFQSDTVMRSTQSFVDNYNSFLITNEDCYGINNRCLLNLFPIKNLDYMYPPCFAHDILEGIGPKIFIKCLSFWRNSNRLIYDNLVNIISIFPLHSNDKLKFPKLFLDNVSLNRFVAHESYYLYRFLPYFIYKSELEDDESHVKLLLLLGEIILFLYKLEFTNDDLIFLDNLISSFLSLCSELYPDIITIKFHHLIHYSYFISIHGSPRQFSTLPFESLHSELKSFMRTSNNWRNQCLTMGKKYARMHCNDFSKNIYYKLNNSAILDNSNILTHPPGVTHKIKSFNYYNFLYKSGSFILKKNLNLDIKALEVQDIYSSDSDIIFYCKIYDTFYDLEHNFIRIYESHNFEYIDFNEVKSHPNTYIIYEQTTSKILIPFYKL